MSRLRALRILPLLLAAVVAGGAAGAVEARPVATAPNDAVGVVIGDHGARL